MPIENNETILGTITTTDDVDISISPEAVRRFEQMLRRNAFDPYEEAKPLPKKVVKKKTTAQLLEELSSKNCEVFDNVNKAQEEIDRIEGETIEGLAIKYDTLLFTVIGKNYTLKGMSETKALGYINTLRQSLLQTLIRYVYNPERYGEFTEGRFIENLLELLMSRIQIDDKNLPIIKGMGKDLYKFMNDITEAKKKKKEIMGRQKSKPTVCEDYLNELSRVDERSRTTSGTVNVRFEPVFARPVSWGSASGSTGSVTPF